MSTTKFGSIIDFLNLMVSSFHAMADAMEKSGPVLKQLEQKMPGWFGIGFTDESGFIVLRNDLTIDEQGDLNRFLNSLSCSRGDQFRRVVTSILNVEIRTPRLDGQGKPMENSKGEVIYETTIVKPAVPFLKDIARLAKIDPTLQGAKEACFAGGTIMENQVHEKIWRGIVHLWAIRDQGVAFAQTAMNQVSASLMGLMQPLTQHVFAYENKPWWKKILFMKQESKED